VLSPLSFRLHPSSIRSRDGVSCLSSVHPSVSACFLEQAEALERSEFAQRKLDAIVARQAGPKGPKVKREAAMRIQARVRAFSCRKRLKERHAAAMHSMKIFFLLGGPGSGKSTYAKRLCAEFGVLHLSVGKLLVSCRHAYMQRSLYHLIGRQHIAVEGRRGDRKKSCLACIPGALSDYRYVNVMWCSCCGWYQ
jgi:hypothetical protein